MPSMVKKRTEKSLINSSALECNGQAVLVVTVHSEHVGERVEIIFEPKVVCEFDVETGLGWGDEGSGFAGIDDDILVIGVGTVHSKWSFSGFEPS